MKIINYFCILNLYTILSYCQNLPTKLSDEKISFGLADITIDTIEYDSVLHLQAYKSSGNDDILNNKKIDEYGKLFWVSLGNPTLIRKSNINDKENDKIFHFSPEGFYTYIEMLTDKHKQLILDAIKRKYNINISSNQILNLILSQFHCSLRFFANGKNILFSGDVNEFRNFPLKLTFWAPIGSIERELFQERLKSNKYDEHSDLELKCEISSGVIETKKNVLTINLNQINEFNLVERLFGPADSVYVTRDQLNHLANELYTNLNIIEEYELPLYQFNEEFVTALINQVAANVFNYVSFEQAIKYLSKYSTNFKDDLNPDKIFSELSNLYLLKKEKDYKYIVRNDESFNSLGIGFSVGGSVGFLGIGASKSINTQYESRNSGKTLNEQLDEINKESENNIEWKFDGEKIVPKSIKVAKISKISFSKSLVFNRIRKLSNDALFKRKISLFTTKFSNSPLIQKLPIGSILTIGTKIAFSMFDKDGKGFGEYLGWYLCDGRNGAPDLSGKFLVNYDNNYIDYADIGKSGGSNHLVLTVDQLPSHTHHDSGHVHYVNLRSSQSGSHQHHYKDIYFSEVANKYGNNNGGSELDYTRTTGFGQLGRSDWDNVGYQMGRRTEDNGIHDHTVLGNSQTSEANLSNTGKNEKIDKRPPYYVVAYIIFLDIF